jgi:predicted aminopeptidase
MKKMPTKYQRLTKKGIKGLTAFILSMVMVMLVLSGCESISYYSQAIRGHSQIIFNQQKINEVLANSDTEEGLKQQLQLSQDVIAFARKQLRLPKNKSYTKYVDTGREYAVWNVVATPRYSVDPLGHCFPITGCVSYKGYYALDEARAYAGRLKDDGYDVSIGSVAAYSTLGWFDDPLLNTMLTDDEVALAGTLIHELTHQQVYLKGDTAFNESFATAVEELGLQKWLQNIGKEAQWQRYQIDKRGRQQVLSLILRHRKLMAKAYEGISDEANDESIALKALLFSDLKNAYQIMRSEGRNYGRFDQWFNSDLNNASLVLFADYNQWVPAFKQLHEQTDTWSQFYVEVEEMAQLDSESRNKQLQQLTDKWLVEHAK